MCALRFVCYLTYKGVNFAVLRSGSVGGSRSNKQTGEGGIRQSTHEK